MIRLDAATLAPGGDDLLIDATWHLHPGAHVGLVGRNGSGKTTLLRAMAGELDLDAGALIRRNNAQIGYLPQQAVSGSIRTVWEEARSAMTRLLALGAEVDAAQAAVEGGSDEAIERLDAATEAFRGAGGYREDETIGEVLHGLGFAPDAWHRPCAELSGGWQMRVALARVLLAHPDVALLDEPTNHLDLDARTWLGRHLAAAPFAVVLVSHDRYLLDRVTTRIVEVRGGQLHHYRGNFSAFVVERDARVSAQQTTFERQQAEIERLERFVTRFKAKATKAAAARSKQKALDRIDRVEAPGRLERRPRFRLPAAPPGDAEACKLDGVTLGWDRPLLTGATLVLGRGMRVAAIGPNGCGKSTLLQTLAGTLRPLSGRRRLGDRIRIGTFSQDHAAALPPTDTPVDYVTSQAPEVPTERIRAALGGLGLSSDAALRPIGALSGGEKARVALAILSVRPHNLLLLDEPTNHLDIETVEVLVEALTAFDGAMLVVSHDRWLVQSVATHVVQFVDGTIELREGIRDSDFEAVASDQPDEARDTAGADAFAVRKARQRERERAERRIAAIEGEVEAAEAEVARIDEALFAEGGDYERAAALETERRAAQARVDALYSEWQVLDEVD